MNYEEKKAIIIQSIIEADKLKYKGKHPTLYLHKAPLDKIDQKDIIDITTQFVQLDKLITGKIYLGEFKPFKKAFESIGGNEPDYSIELTSIDLKYFEDEFVKYRQYIKESNKIHPTNEYFIIYTHDRRILINGDIEIGSTNLNSENDLVFQYLYDNKNKIIQKSDIKKLLGGNITKDFDKILENLGFVKGIRSTFIDMDKITIKLKSPIRL